MSPKRRILVVFEHEGKRLKLAVSIDRGATNAALAQEIAETVGEQGVTLEVGGGFELRGQDAIDVILDSDIVIARLRTTQPVPDSPSSSSQPDSADVDVPQNAIPESLESTLLVFTPPPPYGSTLPLPIQQSKPPEKKDQGGESRRFQICLVTADLARIHAKETLRASTEPTNGMLAFNGEIISGNTTVAAVRKEAALVFGWISDHDTFGDDPCNHENISSCSCAIAREVEQHGLFSTLHCRLTIDGTRCSNNHCPYSHTRLFTNVTPGLRPPHCAVCTEALESQCPSCLKDARKSFIELDSCPIIKNAGCGHLHHAHCLGLRKDSSLLGCPSGCPRGPIIREAIPFDQNLPSIVIVWDGDKIDRIPIPSIHLPPSVRMLRLNTEVVISLVEEFLASKSLRLDNLSVRIHARDPTNEIVSFTWTTLVSVCPSASHQNQDHRRFSFFAKASSFDRSPKNEPRNFCVDFHTSKLPIMVCGCTRLADLFLDSDSDSHDALVTLYAVKRWCGPSDTPHPTASGASTSKQLTYLLDPAWQPSNPQTNRGMAALLSSLFVLSHIVSKKGAASENTVLGALYAITRFPPAVRALGLLFLNITPQPQEKAALSNALFHSLDDFSKTAPRAIAANCSRRFETVRLLLGQILAITETTAAIRPLEAFPLVCYLSHKRLTDPALLGYSSATVERSTGAHFLPGGVLYRPENAKGRTSLVALVGDELRQVLLQTTQFRGSEIHGLSLHGIPRITLPTALERSGHDFESATRQANETDLISRGPLELKSPTIIPPQIVLDEQGLLAVFTGRGCGTSRDVNFFQPTSGGDTEVDVNDVEHALQKVIEARKHEDTWEIDRFGGIPAKSRLPDEAIMLCLDLSRSMNERSSVGDTDSVAGSSRPSNYNTEALKAVAQVIDGSTPSVILLNAKNFLKEQHESCHVAWKSLIADGLGIDKLIDHLATMAGRDVLRIKLSGGAGLKDERRLLLLASVASASLTQKDVMVQYLEEFLRRFERSSTLGAPPYDMPRDLVDPLTGDLLSRRPSSSNSIATLGTSRAQWVLGQDVLNGLRLNDPSCETVTIALHHQGMVSSWKLPIWTPTRVLYSLANRVTQAKYSSFTLRMCISKAEINDSTRMPISSTDLGDGGVIEISRLVPHTRKLHEFIVTFNGSGQAQTVLLPADASALALISHIRAPNGDRLSEIQLWHGLWNAGDGQRSGIAIHTDSSISRYTGLECHRWSPAAILKSIRKESQSLTRLELLKELFNILINRVSSFDTSVSLVLGLVTFSDQAHVKQELTPIFENFRLELDKVQATGDTAMYDAMDIARSCLVKFHGDLPNLRRRIIIVSDGEDTSSKCTIKEVGSALQRDDIVVDTVQVGQVYNSTLHAFSAATGGYRFFPKTSLGDALSIFDLETMLYSGERPTRSKAQRAFSEYRVIRSWNTLVYPIDAVTIDRFPQRAQHPKLQERVSKVDKARGPEVPSNDRMRRIMRELKALVADPHPQIDVYVNDEDISFLKVVIEAPNDIEQCPYKGGCFLLICDLPAGYPRNAPEIRFVTFILHPNVSKQGKVCIAELSRLWSSDITLKELLCQIYGLLLEPDLENPLEIQASLKYYDDDGTFAHAAATAVKEHASKSRSEWRKELEV